MKLVDRLIFGTARLAGGGAAKLSRQLIEDCLIAGVTRFDTAPNYGMGAAEQILGEVIGSESSVQIHTKAGLPRPRFVNIRGWIKHALQRSPSHRSVLRAPRLLEYEGPARGGSYAPEELERSIDRSRHLLGRDRLDGLFLHAAEPNDVGSASWQVFENALETGLARKIGFAHRGPVKDLSLLRTEQITQIAPCIDDFTTPSDHRRIFHSVRAGSAIALSAGGAACGKVKRVGQQLGSQIESETAGFLAGLIVLANQHPQANMIFATTSRSRLQLMLSQAAAIELEDFQI